ncbi:MAG TPA: hypothetical protein VFC69_05200 [Dysgonamonadaceae bacterium]|nr:hypothetical protein [Dysgonamonadaceae bacterium]
MSELVIRYAISKRLKLQALIASVYLMVISIVMVVLQLMNSQYNALFFVGVVGFVIALSLLLSSTISQPKPLVRMDNDEFELNFPMQRLSTTLYWNEVSHIGIGLSYITLLVAEQELSVDLELLRYHDLKVLKAKLIEVAESKTIPYNNI